MSARCPATAAVRAGIDADTAFGAVTPPIVLSSNFSFDGFGNKRAYDYTRSGNPTRDLLGEALAELEGGAGGVVTATGMGAITLVLNALLWVAGAEVPERGVVTPTPTLEELEANLEGSKPADFDRESVRARVAEWNGQNR